MIIKLYQLYELYWLAIHGEGLEYVFRKMDESGMGWTCVHNGGVDFADCFDDWRNSFDSDWPSFETFLTREFSDEEYVRKLVKFAGPLADELWEAYIAHRHKESKMKQAAKKAAVNNVVVPFIPKSKKKPKTEPDEDDISKMF